jgi:hypothetical protein
VADLHGFAQAVFGFDPADRKGQALGRRPGSVGALDCMAGFLR